MPRLPRTPALDWKPDGTPIDTRHGDVYFTAGDGLEEARAVFLAGCGLPDGWVGRTRFTVGETGFGTGLNFLATWQLWRRSRPSPSAWLNFVSFEGFPLLASDAARALSAWPELAELAGQLVSHWPDGARGVRELVWPQDGVRLVLHVGEITETLPQAMLEADAWFLDGFSPARNAQMWSPALYPLLAERAAPGARLATFTVAGDVRRGLREAGFEVAKRPGHGRKRERLEAHLCPTGKPRRPDRHGLRSPPEPMQKVAVLGAGIAGASLASQLVARGCQVSVFDRAKGPAQGASGNRLALVMPRLDAGDTPEARLLVDAYLAARRAYDGRPGVCETQVRQMPRNDREARRFCKLLGDPPLPLEDLEALPGGGLLHKRALIVEPARLISALLDGVDTRYGRDPAPDLATRKIEGETFDAIILAHGMGAAQAAPFLGLEARLGQVESVSGLPDAAPSATASGHYALALGGERLWGATFEAHDGPPRISEDARSRNAAALEGLSPWWMRQALDRPAVSRAGIRATTPDRLPVAGPLPDPELARERFGGLRHGREITGDAPRVAGIWLATGLGSRGFTFAPWIAGLLTAQLCGDPAPASREACERVSAMRFLLRGFRRGSL
ncbi:MAG: FAD-dependent 5-carboxymethylaminomethyl-2-thiouridine(34) oxidoreductase MnmC [Alphaproteobacteria bacterium]|jgi:tRNA 5-methylaminomethyl-2-thiouridine biosynthesis bifunctional protein|nr:FAD-dependent 5-carboxymethylaminomethyl-2-thiouridine(34) oxidoreductase MnmC [Alphaproteobacteria bacterium]